MNQKLTKIVAVIILVCFLSVFAVSFLSPFTAGAVENKNEIKQKMNQAEQEKRTVLAEKSQLETKIEVIQGEIDGIQSEINALSDKISKKEVELSDAKDKSEKQYDSMKIRLRTMYEDNSSSYITLLFGGETLGDIVSYIELIKQVLNHDENMYEEFLDTQEKIAEDKKVIEDARSEEQKKKQSVETKKSELQTQQGKLQVAADKLTNDIEAYKKAYEEAEAAEQRAREEAARKAREAAEKAAREEAAKKAQQGSSTTTVPSTPSSSGLVWPTAARGVSSQYGWRMHPIFKTRKFHSGIDINAPMGSSVIASAAGTVVTAAYDAGYGYYVVVSHANGLATLYAHNSSLSVSVGQKVSQGQQIAISGSTGFSTGPHLHFEVLKNGATTNPLSYF